MWNSRSFAPLSEKRGRVDAPVAAEMVEFGVAAFGSVEVEGRRVEGSVVGYSCSISQPATPESAERYALVR